MNTMNIISTLFNNDNFIDIKTRFNDIDNNIDSNNKVYNWFIYNLRNNKKAIVLYAEYNKCIYPIAYERIINIISTGSVSKIKKRKKKVMEV